MNAVRSPEPQTPPSFLKGFTLAAATVALSMWGIGTLWMKAESSAQTARADATVAEVLAPATLR